MARYDPFEEMDRMFEQMRTRMWNAGGPFGELDVRTRGRSETNLDLTEREGEYVLVADVPGFEKEEIDLTFDRDALTIAAEHEVSDAAETTGEAGELATTEFSRSRNVTETVTVPEEVREDDITATYRNGVLEVHLPLVEQERADDEGDGKQIGIED